MRSETGYGNGIFTVVKATVLALAVSLLGVVIFAVLLRTGVCGEKGVYTINQVIKGVSIALGVFTFVSGEKGWIKGGGVALLFTALSYLAFSAIGGDFTLGWMIVLEALTAFFVGVISGILAVNLKK